MQEFVTFGLCSLVCGSDSSTCTRSVEIASIAVTTRGGVEVFQIISAGRSMRFMFRSLAFEVVLILAWRVHSTTRRIALGVR